MKLRSCVIVVFGLLAVLAFASTAAARSAIPLRVAVTGKGFVRSKPTGIFCPGACRASFRKAASVRLTATAAPGSKFVRWVGGCPSGRVCSVRLRKAKTVRAVFALVATPAPTAPTQTPTTPSQPVTPNPTPTPPPAPGSSRDNPVPLGTFAAVPIGSTPGWQLRINSATPDATQQVLAANMFNDPPAAGKQFYLFSVSYMWTGASSAHAGFVDSGLKVVGPSNVGYAQGTADSCGVLPAPDFGLISTGVDLFTGGVITGNECFSVLSSDAAGLILYDSEFDKQPVWFALR